MKKLIILSFTVAFLGACNPKNNKAGTTQTPPVDTTATKEAATPLYACPMHPEATGKKDSECPKCGMPLTEPVK